MTNKRIKYHQVDPQISELAKAHKNDPEALLAVLTDVQEQRNQLAQAAIADIGYALHTPPAYAYGVASFYSMLNLGEKAENAIRVCDGPVCWLCGSDDARQAVDREFDGKPDWKVGRTSCLGLCDRAPAMLVNEQQASNHTSLARAAYRLQPPAGRRTAGDDG